MFAMRTRFPATALLLLSAVSCDSPFEPRGEGERVPVGQVIEDALSGDSVRRYSFAAGAGGVYAVFLESLQGSVQLTVVDSAHQQTVGSLVATPASGSLDQNATQFFPTLEGGVYLLRVTAFPAGATARFRFLVYRVTAAPETRPARFAIGDTVTGEVIDPIVDLDEFVAHGETGQEVVAVVQAQSPAGAGAIAMLVVDPTTEDLLSLAVHAPTTPAPPTTGRFRLPASQDYQFTFSSIVGTFPRYRGPYRFWSYLIDRSPEHHPAAVTIGSAIGGEAIDRAGDVDEFTFQATAGMELNAFLQSSRTLQLEVAPASGPALAAVTSGGPDTSLFRLASGRFQVTQAGTYVVRVMGQATYDIADTGSYRFFLYPIDRRPERATAAIIPGDTIAGEAVDLPGDVDEFTFTSAPGEEFTAFLQTQSGSSQTVMLLDAVDANGTVLKGVLSVGSDTSLLQQQTGRFTLLTSGTHRLRVSGALSTIARDTGAFRLFLYHVHRQPEALLDSLVFGDSTSGEAIDAPGDVDEFRVTVPDSSGANLVAQIETDATGGALDVTLVDTGGHVIAGALPLAPDGFGQSGAILLRPGTYTLRVQGYSIFGDDRSPFVGRYRVWLYKFRFEPEVAPDTIAIGDTITEALDPPGDVDVFRFFGRRGDHLNLALEGQGAPTAGGFGAYVFGPSNQFLSVVYSPTTPDSLGSHETGRIDLTDGLYHITVSGGSSPPQLFEEGSYRFAITHRSTAPESAGATLVPGDSVTNEAIDTPDDWDEFTLTGTPGQLLTIVARTIDPAPVGYPLIAAFDSITTDTLALTAAPGFDNPSGYFTMPASGRLKIAVYHPMFGFGGDFLGGYRFVVVPVNPAPESAPTTFALGDTIRGEAISPAMDVDEFLSTGAPGDTLVPGYRLVADPVPSGKLITLEVVDPTTGIVLVGSGVSLFAAGPFVSPGLFIVPPGGSYVIRVRGGGLGGEQLGTAPYEFFVRPGP